MDDAAHSGQANTRRNACTRVVRISNKHLVLAAGIVMLLALAGLPAASEDTNRCAGVPHPQPHTPPIGFNFETDSSAERGSNGYRTFWVCVRNHDDEDVHVVWYVPQFDVWVLPGKQTPYPRPRNDVSARRITGCLKYGNVGNKIYAEFLGTRAEEILANEHVQQECGGLGKDVTPAPPDDLTLNEASSQPSGGLQPISLEYAIHFPSNLSRTRETMLSFRARIDLNPLSEVAYTAELTYTVAKVEGRPDGDPASVRVQAGFTGLAESLYPFFNRAYPKGFSPLLGETLTLDNPITGGAIKFEVSGTKDWVLSSAAFRFLDRDQQLLATLVVPVFVPQRQ